MNTDTTATSTPSGVDDGMQLDEFGRTDAERTVMLTSAQADLVNGEVEAGRHESYDAALEYVIERGFAEINRQRKSQEDAAKARAAAKGKDQFNKFLALDPTIVTRPELLMKLLKECGLTNGSNNGSH